MRRFWEHNDCIVLFWNKEKHVIGLKVEKKGNKLNVLDTASSSSDTEQLAIAIAEVENLLVAEETHLMLAGCNLPGSVSIDINIPKMSHADMRQAISYELPRHIPCDVQDLIFGYRIITPEDDAESAKITVRIVAVMKRQWNEILSELTGSGIKIDAMVTPFLAVDPLMGADDQLLFSDSQDIFLFSRSPEYPGRRIIVRDLENNPDLINKLDYKQKIKELGFVWDKLPSEIKDDPGMYLPSLLIAAYGLTPEFSSDKHTLIKLPNELVPERYRTLRTAFFALIATIILLVLMLVGRFWLESVNRYEKIKDEISSVEFQKERIVKEQNKLYEKTALINQIIETDKGNAEVLTCIQKITQELPKEMWLGHFHSRGDSIDLSFRYTKSGIRQPNFNKAGIFNTIRSSKRSSRDGSTTESVKLEYIPPEKRNEQ